LLKLGDICFDGLPDLLHIQLPITVRGDIPDFNDLHLLDCRIGLFELIGEMIGAFPNRDQRHGDGVLNDLIREKGLIIDVLQGSRNERELLSYSFELRSMTFHKLELLFRHPGVSAVKAGS